ncbi:zinc finger CCHC domain-containing protein 7 isoform X1 [Hippocampus zosterae]|uniref:zinc finger CCHC domain-containing protein 7 isoform X1 n=1 Tax=Hippocampus zosterae TaxID=109293 RepID=UPI00223D7A1E|nr:zinc finger CCHC domain-containing protein 7 isoform X1 [Hippocampus zosterae]XP_051940216.1 zinc finger CCHC domain-containing protein 7 isoform X1 [Hippocampus zosterae]XP_051940217.1 zinc finger CCHC domain-containing protein 7 isoform X1 [Hippocampus zosterae]XP_051940218.1 zinc finger CCHC domain-containing protein 7 isoform X1 [Hippocampus zosterae]
MYCGSQDRQVLEDDLYQGDGDESETSEAISELEFHLYSQLHYSSNSGHLEVEDGEEQPSQEIDAVDKTTEMVIDVDLENCAKNGPRSLKTVKLQEQCNKSETLVKRKKKKSVPEVQRPSPLFEDVIIIDSSPEVISISESLSSSSDDDYGVCALKGGSGLPLLTSTLVPKTPHRKVDVITPVTLDSSASQSDSELEYKSDSDLSLSSNSSHSDVVEKWMILGQGNEDGDQCISLNLEGGSDSNAEVEEDGNWLISVKDREAQIFNKDGRGRAAVSRVVNRYYTEKNVRCRSCDKMGHLSKNCPEPKTPVCFLCGNSCHKTTGCPHKHCNNCGLPGHVHRSCNERPYYRKQCHRCGMTGHFFDACPEIWRQYHVSTKVGPPQKPQREHNSRRPAYCYNCSKKGHFGHGCTQQRMFKWTYATNPGINYYDTSIDVKRRQNRLKSKAEELKKIGFMPDNSQTWLTNGSPKKKQKISHATNGHLFNTKLDRTACNPKATRNHIFFNDGSDSEAALFPKNKFNKHRRQASAGKQWKPKRAVPKERPALPKLIVDDGGDFPRGKGGGVKPKKKSKKNKQGSAAELKDDFRTVPGKTKKDKHEKRNRCKKMAVKMYPTDENLFNIKQRKCKR